MIFKIPSQNRTTYTRSIDENQEKINTWFFSKFKELGLKKRRYYKERVFSFKGTFRIKNYIKFFIKNQELTLQAWMTYKENLVTTKEFPKTDVLGGIDEYQFDQIVTQIMADFDLMNKEAIIIEE